MSERSSYAFKPFYLNSALAIGGLAAGLHHGASAAVMVLAALIVAVALSIRLSVGVYNREHFPGHPPSEQPCETPRGRTAGRKLRWWCRHVLIPVCVTFAAWGYGYATEAMNRSNIGDELDGREVTVQGKIVSAVTTDGDRVSFRFHVDELIASDVRIFPKERVQTTVYLDERAEQLLAGQWQRGMRLRFAGTLQKPGTSRNFGDFDYRDYLHKQRVHWQLIAEGLGTVEIGSRPAPGASRWLGGVDRFRGRLGQLVTELFDERYAGFMQGLLIGDQRDIPAELYEMFSDVGMTHVLAISGLHVSVFTAGCFWLLRLCRLTKERTYDVCLLLVPLYVLATGASPSAIRAGIMAMLGLIALRTGRWKQSLRFLMIAALAMLIVNPYYLYSVSFQLSFVVTFGLIMFVPRLAGTFGFFPRPVAVALAVTIAAQLFSFPLVIHYFHIVHALSPAANLLLVPLVSVLILPLGMIALLLGACHASLGQLPAAAASFFAEWLFRAVEWTANTDALLMSWPRAPLWWMACYYLTLFAIFVWPPVLRMTRFRRMSRGLMVLGGAWMIALLVYGYAGDRWDRTGIVSVLDVGQGDAILIRTPQGRHILVDGGGTFRYGTQEEWKMRKDPYEVGKDTIVPLLRRRGVHRLDAVIATHLDADHVGGLHAVIENIPTTYLLYNGTRKDSLHAERLMQAAEKRGVPAMPISACMTWRIDPHTIFEFLHPIRRDGEAVGRYEADQNGASIVLLIRMYDASFLLTGDIGGKQEREIMRFLETPQACQGGAGDAAAPVAKDEAAPRPGMPDDESGGGTGTFGAPRIDMLKIAHHGSRHSSTPEWLRYWNPVTAVISVGRNNYGHPSADTIDRLNERGTAIFRTDRHGEIQYAIAPKAPLSVRTKISAE